MYFLKTVVRDLVTLKCADLFVSCMLIANSCTRASHDHRVSLDVLRVSDTNG